MPPTPVFDEYHVGRFVLWFDEQLDSFDLHPPLLKMLFPLRSITLSLSLSLSLSLCIFPVVVLPAI